MKGTGKAGAQNISPPQVRGRAVPAAVPSRGQMRRTVLPPMDPTMRFSVPSSSAQQIRFQLSGFPEMPEFSESRIQLSNQIRPVMPVAGRTVPKFSVQSLDTASPKTRHQYQPNSPRRLSGSDKKGKSLLARFDESVSNPNLRTSFAKATKMKKQAQRDLEQRVPPPGAKIVLDEMEQMKQQFIGEITSELGFGAQAKNTPRSKAVESLDVINSKIKSMMHDWGTEVQKPGNYQLRSPERRLSEQVQPQVRRISSLSMKRNLGGKPPSGKIPTSGDKLNAISQGFRQSLLPISTRNPRELIKTPKEDLISDMSDQQRKLRQKEQMDEERRALLANRFQSDVVDNSGVPNPMQPQKIGSGMIPSTRVPGKKPKGKATRSQEPSRDPSQDFSGLMDFQTLLTAQESQLNPPQTKGKTGRKKVSSRNPILSETQLLQVASSHGLIAGTTMHGKLKNSVKTIDQAAKMAEKLGTLMSRVANSQQNSNMATESSKPNLQASDDIQKRVSHLRRVAEEAKKSLTKHTVSSGNSPRLDNETQTQTESVTKHHQDFGKVEFTPEMSYTDQLILKKLRETQRERMGANNK